jgi:hypothetical protein
MTRLTVIFAFVLLAGCGSNQLETGYKPRPLTDTPALRKAYYTNPYSPDASPDAGGAGAPDASMHRPRGF